MFNLKYQDDSDELIIFINYNPRGHRHQTHFAELGICLLKETSQTSQSICQSIPQHHITGSSFQSNDRSFIRLRSFKVNQPSDIPLISSQLATEN